MKRSVRRVGRWDWQVDGARKKALPNCLQLPRPLDPHSHVWEVKAGKPSVFTLPEVRGLHPGTLLFPILSALCLSLQVHPGLSHPARVPTDPRRGPHGDPSSRELHMANHPPLPHLVELLAPVIRQHLPQLRFRLLCMKGPRVKGGEKY